MITDQDETTKQPKPLIGKIRHNKSIRYIELPETLDAFIAKWKQTTGDVLNKKTCLFTYIDDENDAIRITLDEEYLTALQIIRQVNEKNNTASILHMELQYTANQNQIEKNEVKTTTPSSYKSILQKGVRFQLDQRPNFSTSTNDKNPTQSPSDSNNNNNQPAISIETSNSNNTSSKVEEVKPKTNPKLNHPFFTMKGPEKSANVKKIKELMRDKNATEKLAKELVSMGFSDLEENKKLLIENENKFRKVVKILVTKNNQDNQDNQDKTISPN